MEKKSALFDLSNLKERLSGPNLTKVLLIIGSIGIALIFISSFWPPANVKDSSTTISSSISTAAYATQTEKQLKGIISLIDGVGRVEVMVTVGNGVEYVYEQNAKTSLDKTQNSQSDGSIQSSENGNSEQNPVVIDNPRGGQQPIVKTEIQPTIKGVVVVCDGGNNAVVKENIIVTVMTALDLSANHISVNKYVQK